MTMAQYDIIDLTAESTDEENEGEAPRQAAIASFQPRKEKRCGQNRTSQEPSLNKLERLAHKQVQSRTEPRSTPDGLRENMTSLQLPLASTTNQHHLQIPAGNSKIQGQARKAVDGTKGVLQDLKEMSGERQNLNQAFPPVHKRQMLVNGVRRSELNGERNGEVNWNRHEHIHHHDNVHALRIATMCEFTRNCQYPASQEGLSEHCMSPGKPSIRPFPATTPHSSSMNGRISSSSDLQNVCAVDDMDGPDLSLETDLKRKSSVSHHGLSTRPPKRRPGGSRRDPKRPMQSPRHEPTIIFNDVTDSAMERVSLSSEPGLPEERITKQDTGPDIILPINGLKPQPTLEHAEIPPSTKRPRGGRLYSAEEDWLLQKLRGELGPNWEEIASHFEGRTPGGLQFRYSTKFSNKHSYPAPHAINHTIAKREPKFTFANPRAASPDTSLLLDAPIRGKRIRKRVLAEGFVGWASLKNPAKHTRQSLEPADTESPVEVQQFPASAILPGQDRVHHSSLPRILRQRELGTTGRGIWTNSYRSNDEETRNHVFGTYSLATQYQKTSGDVVSLSWSYNAVHFAAGSIAISDATSMQYNMARNLLLGDRERSELKELAEHWVRRPLVQNADNVNGRHAMRESQDPRLFTTVTSTSFSPSGQEEKLYTTSTDRMLRVYSVADAFQRAKSSYAIEHPTSVDLLAVHNGNAPLVATGCHSASNSINVFRCDSDRFNRIRTFTPSYAKTASSASVFPSSLKWGVTHAHANYLLAGFSGDADKELAGETCLWHVETGESIPLAGATRNVFDVGWNASASGTSIAFAVASAPSGVSVGRGMRSVVQCFALGQTRNMARVRAWECPALDINDVVFCPYDDNLIAAGATDGKVYIWDQRFAANGQLPLHILQHEQTRNVLDHDRDREVADTGVRFLSWGATKTRLYSGSSDGIVKCWNPYCASDDSHVNDIISPGHQMSAVMSGAFSPDHRDLLVGTEDGRIDLFTVAVEPVYRVQQFKLRTAPSLVEEQEAPFRTARDLLNSRQIEIRPAGAMPFRQAVQGPNYEGPFLAPTAAEVAAAEENYEQALRMQADTHQTGMNANAGPSSEDVAKAERRVRDAQDHLDDIWGRFSHFKSTQPAAQEHQRMLVNAEDERRTLEAQLPDLLEACKLDCRALPSGDEIEDSGRSELRIPGVLRSTGLDAARAPTEEPDESCTGRCLPMSMHKATKNGGWLCSKCKLIAARLSAVCIKCSGPSRVDTDVTKETICELCKFSCFRCGNPAKVTPELTHVICAPCGLSWEAGVLGYELTAIAGRRNIQRHSCAKTRDDWDEFGIAQQVHFLWENSKDDSLF